MHYDAKVNCIISQIRGKTEMMILTVHIGSFSSINYLIKFTHSSNFGLRLTR